MKTIDRLCVAVGASLLASSAMLSIPVIRAKSLEVETAVRTVSRPNPATRNVKPEDVDRLSQAMRDLATDKLIPLEDLRTISRLKNAHTELGVYWDPDRLHLTLTSTEHEYADMKPRALVVLGACSGVGAGLLAWGLIAPRRRSPS